MQQGHNELKRLIKTPKYHFVDTGLLATELGLTIQRCQSDRHAFGSILETFVYSELLKQATWAQVKNSNWVSSCTMGRISYLLVINYTQHLCPCYGEKRRIARGRLFKKINPVDLHPTTSVLS